MDNNLEIINDENNRDNMISPINDYNSDSDMSSEDSSDNSENAKFIQEKWRMMRIVGGANIIPPILKC